MILGPRSGWSAQGIVRGLCCLLCSAVLLLSGGSVFFFFNDTAPPEISTLSLHDPLPISRRGDCDGFRIGKGNRRGVPPLGRNHSCRRGTASHTVPRPRHALICAASHCRAEGLLADRKSTRLNSSHSQTSYAVFCLKK